VIVKRVMTDNGAAYRSHAHAAACQQLGLKDLFTAPYRPRTNGKKHATRRLADVPRAYTGLSATMSPQLFVEAERLQRI
jgi:transposase InsO family protein